MRRVWAALVLVALLLGVVAAPVSAGGDTRSRPKVPGMVHVESNRSFDDTWATLIEALDANPNVGIVAEIDHAAAAASAGLDLDPNRVVFFGNPNLGAPLMQINQTTGIDLPQKIHVFEDGGRVWVGFNDTNFLKHRHGLGDAPTLDTIAGALRAFAGVAADERVLGKGRSARVFARRPDLVTVPSDDDVDTTWNRLLSAIDASPADLAFQVDHSAAAAGAGLALRPTRLAVFGNPNIGTPVMARRATAGVDLPLKILVWEDADGTTQVTTNDVRHLRFRHRLRRGDVEVIAGALDAFLAAATG